jgi:ribosome-binding protein aMBF1 (putative translation factor)
MNLQEERLNRGLSIPALAREIDVADHVIRHAEKGGIPNPANALKIASFFGGRVTDFWPANQPNGAAA